jgi:type II secretory pathway component PulM
MMDWWLSRDPREKRLITLAGALLIAVLIIQLIFIPTGNARNDARQANTTAAQNLDAVTAGLARVASQSTPLQPGKTQQSADTLRSITINLARDRGLNVARVGNSRDGALTISIEGAPPQLIYIWLAELSGQYSVEPTQVNLVTDSEQLISASVTFAQLGTAP